MATAGIIPRSCTRRRYFSHARRARRTTRTRTSRISTSRWKRCSRFSGARPRRTSTRTVRTISSNRSCGIAKEFGLRAVLFTARERTLVADLLGREHVPVVPGGPYMTDVRGGGGGWGQAGDPQPVGCRARTAVSRPESKPPLRSDHPEIPLRLLPMAAYAGECRAGYGENGRAARRSHRYPRKLRHAGQNRSLKTVWMQTVCCGAAIRRYCQPECSCFCKWHTGI